MRNEFIIDSVKDYLNEKDHSFLTWSSLPEESIKLAKRIREEKRPVLIIKENNYMASKLRDHLLSYFEEDEVISYLPEESLRAEEIA
ncbi:MAG: hypothetical protein IIZ47_01245, partial [Erysipelotrichaceae bacterium]|nr:hypothetical protein [Erysipelotrichaceae bacterium]